MDAEVKALLRADEGGHILRALRAGARGTHGAERASLYTMTMRAALREAIETIALAAFLVLILQATIQNYRVEGPSMDPRLVDKNQVLVNKVVYLEIDAARVARFIPGVEAEEGHRWRPFGVPSSGDVIVFRWPNDRSQNFVKRIVGLPGDRIQIRRGTVLVNGVPLPEEYVRHPKDETVSERMVPDDSYWVYGDNRAESSDSRDWGPVHRDDVIGNVWVAYWPLTDFAMLWAGVR